MKPKLQHLYCSKCGCPNPQSLAWLDSNTREFVKWEENDLEVDTDWCPQCREMVQAMNIMELYDEFANVPVNDNGEIMEDFICFSAGTLETDVMSWFDERCPYQLHDA